MELMDEIKSFFTEEEWQISQFWDIFKGRSDVWGGLAGRCIREQVDYSHIRRHLEGETSLGMYPLLDDGTCKWACVDFDFKTEPQSVRFKMAEEYARKFSIFLYSHYSLEINCFFERSKSGLIHLWLFFGDWVQAKKVRAILYDIAKQLDLNIRNGEVEIFPKQDFLEPNHVGNYVNLPYFGGLINKLEKRVIIDIKTKEPVSLKDFIDQVENAKVTPEVINTIYESLPQETPKPIIKPDFESRKIKEIGQEAMEIVIEVLSKYWVEGHRQSLALHLAGFLAKGGVRWEDTKDLIIKIAEGNNDVEIYQRMGAIESTYKKAQNGEEIKGYTGLKELLDSEDLQAITKIFPAPSYKKKKKEIKFLRVVDILSQQTDPERFITKGLPLAMRKGITVITGRPGLGKSWLILDIAKSISQGDSLFEVFETVQGKVAYFDQENSVDILRERMSLLNFPENENCLFYSFANLDIENDFELFMNIARTVDVMIFDSLVQFHHRNENKSSDMKKVMEKFKLIANQCNVSIILLHQVNKPGQMEQDKLYRARGSIQIVYDSDMVFTVERIQGDERILYNIKNRIGKTPKPIKFEIGNYMEDGVERVRLNFLGEYEESGLKRDRTPILVQITLKESPSPLTVEEIKTKLKEKGLDVSEPTLRPILRELETGGIIKSETRLRGRKYYFFPNSSGDKIFIIANEDKNDPETGSTEALMEVNANIAVNNGDDKCEVGENSNFDPLIDLLEQEVNKTLELLPPPFGFNKKSTKSEEII